MQWYWTEVDLISHDEPYNNLYLTTLLIIIALHKYNYKNLTCQQDHGLILVWNRPYHILQSPCIVVQSLDLNHYLKHQ